MIYIFYKMLMFKMLNMNECIFWCECVCVMGGGGGGGGVGGGGWGGVGGGGYSIHYVSAVVNQQCVKM